MIIHLVKPTGRAIATDAGRHRGTMVVMAGTARGTILGTIPGMLHIMILGTTHGTILDTMVGHRLGAMAGMLPTIVRGATIVHMLYTET